MTWFYPNDHRLIESIQRSGIWHLNKIKLDPQPKSLGEFKGYQSPICQRGPSLSKQIDAEFLNRSTSTVNSKRTNKETQLDSPHKASICHKSNHKLLQRQLLSVPKDKKGLIDDLLGSPLGHRLICFYWIKFSRRILNLQNLCQENFFILVAVRCGCYGHALGNLLGLCTRFEGQQSAVLYGTLYFPLLALFCFQVCFFFDSNRSTFITDKLQ